MTFRERVLRRPQTLWIRKAVFQIHLWTGIAVGLYIVVASLSGSAVVFRRELMRVLVNRPQVSAHDATTHRLTEDELGAAARRAFPDYTVTKVWIGRNGERPVDIWMNRGKSDRSICSIPTPARISARRFLQACARSTGSSACTTIC